MGKPSGLLFLIVGIIAILIALFIFLSNPEPLFENRPLSHWVVALARGNSDSQTREATNAISHIGVKAVPLLVKWISDEPFWKTKISQVGKVLPHWLVGNRIIMWEDRQLRLYVGSMEAIAVLGPGAKGAIPELTRQLLIIREPPTDRENAPACLTLARLGELGLPPLVAALTNQNCIVRWRAAESLDRLGRAGGYGQPGKAAIPALLNASLNDPDPQVRKKASEAFYAITWMLPKTQISRQQARAEALGNTRSP
jgi:hypothetical protein